MSFLSDIYSVLNGETSTDTNNYIIETTGNSSLISDTFNLAKNKSLIAFTGNINGKVIFSKNQIKWQFFAKNSRFFAEKWKYQNFDT